MDGLLRANTLKLRQHTDLIRRELHTARSLRDLLRRARGYALPDEVWRYDRLIQDAEALAGYFGAMADQVDRMSFELERLSMEISALLTDARDLRS